MSKIFFITAFWAVSIVAFSCYQKNADSVKTLSFSIAEEIPVPEPSGLDLSVVGDNKTVDVTLIAGEIKLKVLRLRVMTLRELRL